MALRSDTEADIELCARRWHERGQAAALASLEMVCWLRDAVAWEQAALVSKVQDALSRLTLASANHPRYAFAGATPDGAAPQLYALRVPVQAKQRTLSLLRQLPAIDQVEDLMVYDRQERHGVVLVASRWSLAQFSDFVAEARGLEVVRLLEAKHDQRARACLAAEGLPWDQCSAVESSTPLRERSRA